MQTQSSICFISGHDFSMTFLNWEKGKLKTYGVLEFIFIAWEGKMPSVVRYEIRCRRLECSVREIWFLFFSPFHWKLLSSTAPNTTPHCVTTRYEARVSCCVIPRCYVLSTTFWGSRVRYNLTESWCVRYESLMPMWRSLTDKTPSFL